MAPLRLITFDVTGTLLTFRTPVIQQYAQAAAKFGIISDPKQLQQNFKAGWKTLSASHPNFGENTGLGWQEWWRSIVKETFREHNTEYVSPLADELIEHFKTAKAWSIAPGGSDILRLLKEQDIKLGVISNFDPRLHTILKNLDLSQYFSFVLTSYEAGWAKPNVEIFLEALKRGQVGKGCEALHVGNDEKLDVEGARKAGMHSLLIGPSESLRFPEVVDNLVDVQKCVDFINNSE